jgi:DNA polymerase III alpha subunit (gram-positive type)
MNTSPQLILSRFLRNETDIRSALTKFFNWVGDSYLVAHNAAFDLRMLKSSMKLAKMWDNLDESKFFCSCKAFRVRNFQISKNL